MGDLMSGAATNPGAGQTQSLGQYSGAGGGMPTRRPQAWRAASLRGSLQPLKRMRTRSSPGKYKPRTSLIQTSSKTGIKQRPLVNH